jgi:hypothetical protein
MTEGMVMAMPMPSVMVIFHKNASFCTGKNKIAGGQFCFCDSILYFVK